jgi:outer membrane protein assembly factor BamB
VLGSNALYVAHDSGITAFNPSNGSVIWQGAIGSIHWEYPLVTRSRLFVTDHDGKVYAYRIR